MKLLKHLWALALILTSLATSHLVAQAPTRPQFVVLTKTHWNMNAENTPDMRANWMSMEKEYLDKVTKKNDYVFSTALLTHYYTADNSEVIQVHTYKTWDDIEKAQMKFDELEKAAWPDEAKRNAFMDKLDNSYENRHSDNIYATLDGAKLRNEDTNDSSLVVYMQIRYLAYPEDGSNAEFEKLRMEYNQKVIQKNPHILSYYPMRHAWGQDNREFVNAYVVKSLCDVEALNEAWPGLIQAAWPDEAQRKAFFDKYDKYFDGVHGDYIYTMIPALGK